MRKFLPIIGGLVLFAIAIFGVITLKQKGADNTDILLDGGTSIFILMGYLIWMTKIGEKK